MEQSQPKLKVVNGHVYATSLEVAKRFNKAHKNVLRDIQNIISQSDLGLPNDGFSRLNFEPSEHQNHRGKTYPAFNLTRDGFALLAMGFTGREALKWKVAFLTAFNEMEAEIQRRNLRDGRLEQMNLFPGLRDTIEANRPSLSVSACLIIIQYEGLMIPIVTPKRLISMIKRGRLDGFNDGRNWHVYQDSFDTFLRLRRGSVAKAA